LFESNRIILLPNPAKLILQCKALAGQLQFKLTALGKMNPLERRVTGDFNHTAGTALPPGHGRWPGKGFISKVGDPGQQLPKSGQCGHGTIPTKNQLYPQAQPRNAACENHCMKFLVITTLIWAFSFSLIVVYFSGHVDP